MDAPPAAVSEVIGKPSELASSYSGEADRPLGSYLLVMATYGAGVAALWLGVRRSGRQLPDSVAWPDLILTAAATHKLSRLLTKGSVTSPIRAPFTRFEGPSGDAELAESVRGSGLRHAVGELLTCPFCISQWIATSLAFGFVLVPRHTRFVASLFTALAASDFLQYALARAQSAS